MKAAIFDLDGTILDTLDDLATAVNYALAKYNHPVHPLVKYRDFIGDGSKLLVSRAIGKQVSEEEFKNIFDTYMSYYLTHLYELTKPYPGMISMLKKLKEKKWQLFVLTNKPQQAASELIEHFFPNTFKEVLGSLGKYKTKPDPEGLFHLLNTYHLNKDEIVYIGDSHVDMELARNASLPHVVACSYGYESQKILETYQFACIFDSVEEIEKYCLMAK